MRWRSTQLPGRVVGGKGNSPNALVLAQLPEVTPFKSSLVEIAAFWFVAPEEFLGASEVTILPTLEDEAHVSGVGLSFGHLSLAMETNGDDRGPNDYDQKKYEHGACQRTQRRLAATPAPGPLGCVHRTRYDRFMAQQTLQFFGQFLG
jgi:hypothetical protein